MLLGIEGELMSDWGVEGNIFFCDCFWGFDWLFFCVGFVCMIFFLCFVLFFCLGINECECDMFRLIIGVLIVVVNSFFVLKGDKNVVLSVYFFILSRRDDLVCMCDVYNDDRDFGYFLLGMFRRFYLLIFIILLVICRNNEEWMN